MTNSLDRFLQPNRFVQQLLDESRRQSNPTDGFSGQTVANNVAKERMSSLLDSRISSALLGTDDSGSSSSSSDSSSDSVHGNQGGTPSGEGSSPAFGSPIGVDSVYPAGITDFGLHTSNITPDQFEAFLDSLDISTLPDDAVAILAPGGLFDMWNQGQGGDPMRTPGGGGSI